MGKVEDAKEKAEKELARIIKKYGHIVIDNRPEIKSITAALERCRECLSRGLETFFIWTPAILDKNHRYAGIEFLADQGQFARLREKLRTIKNIPGRVDLRPINHEILLPEEEIVAGKQFYLLQISPYRTENLRDCCDDIKQIAVPLYALLKNLYHSSPQEPPPSEKWRL